MDMTNSYHLEDLLEQNVLNVTFTKVDGTERFMKCTRDPNYLPAFTPSETGTKPNPEVVKVFDLEADAWRSFRFDSIKKVEICE